MGEPDSRQLDLFSGPAPIPSSVEGEGRGQPVIIRSTDVDRLDDRALLEAFRSSKLRETALLAEAIRRRRPTGWQDAALFLWKRFFGFGHGTPLPEQRAVLGLLRDRLGRSVLEDILRLGAVPAGLNGDLLLAAAACECPIGLDVVRFGILSRDEALREAAVQIAIPSGLASLELRPLLMDRQIAVRNLAAIVLAEIGDLAARPLLLQALTTRPSKRGLDALALYMDEDAIIQLGQLARKHPGWVAEIRALIEDSAHPRAASILARLPNDA